MNHGGMCTSVGRFHTALIYFRCMPADAPCNRIMAQLSEHMTPDPRSRVVRVDFTWSRMGSGVVGVLLGVSGGCLALVVFSGFVHFLTSIS